ncbi:conserved hypothetical protein [Histoplasma mississippiense (nom. inval.)]|uniref:conserved hypothetical protein n=1 Tax=Ajellomyces capsulatus (strain NAm1 / WU24) TaxID=2059318 RepID=UPI000157CE05|nr:conserved hypothetical protein [Histoplasma mississippiense (nom. inval.)]EDN10661.1 conserved hypothetical protein [Histoplasma mississippiense (nom. inval.)]
MPTSREGTPGVGASRTSREYNSSEVRMERTQVTTRERVQVRSKKQPPSSASAPKSDWEKPKAKKPSKNEVPNPVVRSRMKGEGNRKEQPEAPWEPQANLVPHSTAPLACRVSVPPLSSLVPQALRPPPLRELNMEAQETSILEDLLFVFMGYEGEYIHFVNSYNPSEETDRLIGPSFQIEPGLEPSLKDLTLSMLKMATHYSAMEAFVEVQSRAEFGAVNHALCAAIRKLLKDYLILIAQLENQLLNNRNFTLHVLHLHVMPTSQTPGSMSSKKLCKGGNVLGVLTQRLATFSGDPTTGTLLQTLLREASRPYMTMLNEWLHQGAINDPHAEFLVKEQKGIKRDKLEEDYTDEYWEKRYTIRDSEVPPQLDTVRDKVLLAGKYLNVVRECGGVDISKEIRDVPLTFDDPRFLDNVNSAYAYANASLLNLLLTKNSLTTRFRSLKHYFFLDRSDFFSYFLELGASELRKPAKNVNEGKLQSLLDLVLRQPGSIAAQDPFKEDVKDNPDGGLEKYQTPAPQVTEEEKDIIGFDALELDYMVPFPLSLVISRKTVLRYQLIFRYILSLRHLETLLGASWQDHMKMQSWRHRSSDRKLELWKRRAWTLRARMLIFVQQLLYFCTAEVIEPNWQNLMDRVNGDDADGTEVMINGTKQVNRTVDELMQDHVDFLDTCLKECMLTQGKLLKIHSKLMICCTMFASWTASSLSRSLVSADPDLSGPSSKPSIPGSDATKAYDATRLGKLEDTLKRYEDHFNRHLRILMDSLNYFAATESVVLLKLAHSLSTICKED